MLREAIETRRLIEVLPVLQKPLSPREFDRLDQFLMADEDLENSMDVSTLDGFLGAVLSGPKLIVPSEWMRWVWDMEAGEQQPEFRSEKQAQGILDLLMRHANDVAHTLTYTPENYEPMFYQHEVEGRTVTVIDEWCSGYIKGMSLDPDGWQPLLKRQPDWFEVIDLYGTESGWERLKDLVESHTDRLDRHEALVGRIAPAVRHIHGFWLEHRSESDQSVARRPPTPFRKTPSPGRNDPCPCGSGKKYKRCHGSPENLH